MLCKGDMFLSPENIFHILTGNLPEGVAYRRDKYDVPGPIMEMRERTLGRLWLPFDIGNGTLVYTKTF